jgi:hypothetical protein
MRGPYQSRINGSKQIFQKIWLCSTDYDSRKFVLIPAGHYLIILQHYASPGTYANEL